MDCFGRLLGRKRRAGDASPSGSVSDALQKSSKATGTAASRACRTSLRTPCDTPVSRRRPRLVPLPRDCDGFHREDLAQRHGPRCAMVGVHHKQRATRPLGQRSRPSVGPLAPLGALRGLPDALASRCATRLPRGTIGRHENRHNLCGGPLVHPDGSTDP